MLDPPILRHPRSVGCGGPGPYSCLMPRRTMHTNLAALVLLVMLAMISAVEAVGESAFGGGEGGESPSRRSVGRCQLVPPFPFPKFSRRRRRIAVATATLSQFRQRCITSRTASQTAALAAKWSSCKPCLATRPRPTPRYATPLAVGAISITSLYGTWNRQARSVPLRHTAEQPPALT